MVVPAADVFLGIRQMPQRHANAFSSLVRVRPSSAGSDARGGEAKARERNEYSMPLGFAHRPGSDAWAWWATGCASPGAIRAEYDKWGPVIKAAGIRGE